MQPTGNGPVDAIFNAIKMLVPHEAKLELYQVHAVTEGTDAQAEVSVRLEEDGRIVTGRGADPDTLVASARAYVAALNKLMVKRQKTAQAQQASEPRLAPGSRSLAPVHSLRTRRGPCWRRVSICVSWT